MNGVLLFVLVFFCERATDKDGCVRKAMECVAAAGAYEKSEKQATRIVAECLVPKKPAVQ
jgi:hypothetical protein